MEAVPPPFGGLSRARSFGPPMDLNRDAALQIALALLGLLLSALGWSLLHNLLGGG